MSCVSADMWRYTLLFGLQILNFSLPVSGEGSVTAKLHHPVTLTCDWNCPGLLKWTQYHKQRHVLSQCDQSSCRSEEGFNISHDQYLKGKPYLTITAADYSNTGLYYCHCEDKVICQVDLNIETQKRSHVVTSGEPVDVHLPLTDQVEVSFTASDATQPSNLEICNMTRGMMECKPDYRATVSHLNILQIKVVNVSHSGTYTVRDSMKNKTIAIVKVEVREKQPSAIIDQKRCTPIEWPIVVTVVVVILLFIMGLFFIYRQKKIQQVRTKSAANRPQQLRMTEPNNECQQSRVTENSSNNPGDEGISEETALNDEQQ